MQKSLRKEEKVTAVELFLMTSCWCCEYKLKLRFQFVYNGLDYQGLSVPDGRAGWAFCVSCRV